jgi:hypothetical protein
MNLPESLKAKPITSYSWESHSTVTILGINITNLLTFLFPDYFDMSKWTSRDYTQDREAVKKWCAENSAYYYARDRENFSLSEAREDAAKQGLKVVVYEDLS